MSPTEISFTNIHRLILPVAQSVSQELCWLVCGILRNWSLARSVENATEHGGWIAKVTAPATQVQ